MAVTLRIKRGTDAAIQAGTLAIGELAFATDSKACYTYDGVGKVLVGKAVIDSLSNRPSPGVAGRLFLDTDTNSLYIDTGAGWVGVATSGVPTTTTTVTAGESLSQYQVIYINETDSNKAYKAVCSGTVAQADAIGLVSQTGGLTSNSTGSVVVGGIVSNPSWTWVPNRWIYVGTTAGELTQTTPTTEGYYVCPVGIALTSTQILLSPMPGWKLTNFDDILSYPWTAAENLSLHDIVYSDSSSSGNLRKAVNTSKAAADAIGIVVQENGIAQGNSGRISFGPNVIETGSWVKGGTIYVSDTAGEITQTEPSSGYIKPLGIAVSTTHIYFYPQVGWAIQAS
jgi:hypothetical protein